MSAKRILITGCSTGIGRVTVERLARDGHAVVATARNPATLADLPAADRLALDVCDEASVRAACDAAGSIDVLVNNAGVNVAGPVEAVPLAEVREMFEANFFGLVRMVQAVAPGMRARGGGVIVNVSSIAGRVVPPLGGFYSATKYAVEAISEAMHYELGHFGIRTVVIEPGYFDSAMRDRTRHFGDAGPPYDALRRMWEGSDGKLVGGERPGPETVAAAIAAAIADDEAPLRHPVGKDAETVLAARAQLDDAAFEAAMRSLLDLTW